MYYFECGLRKNLLDQAPIVSHQIQLRVTAVHDWRLWIVLLARLAYVRFYFSPFQPLAMVILALLVGIG